MYLKLGCGVMLGVVPSMTPRSLMVKDPPGSRRAFSRSSTDGLQTHRQKMLNCCSTREIKLLNNQ